MGRDDWVGHGQSAGALTACKFSWRYPSYMIIFLLLTFGLMCTFQIWSVFVKKLATLWTDFGVGRFEILVGIWIFFGNILDRFLTHFGKLSCHKKFGDRESGIGQLLLIMRKRPHDINFRIFQEYLGQLVINLYDQIIPILG